MMEGLRLLRDVVAVEVAGESGCCSTPRYGAAVSNHAEGVTNAMPETQDSTVWYRKTCSPVRPLLCSAAGVCVRRFFLSSAGSALDCHQTCDQLINRTRGAPYIAAFSSRGMRHCPASLCARAQCGVPCASLRDTQGLAGTPGASIVLDLRLILAAARGTLWILVDGQRAKLEKMHLNFQCINLFEFEFSPRA